MRRKWLKWVAWILLTPIILFVILMVLLYIPPVQNLIRKQATAIASEATGMDISVERIDLRFPLNLLVRGVQVIQPIQADKQISSVPGDSLAVKQVSDTLLTLESLNVRVQAWPLIRGKVELDEVTVNGVFLNSADLIEGIRIRGVRQDVLKKEMAASDKVRIQYASKYAGSSNYWKNSIGMNKAIIDNKVLETKAEQEAKFAAFAKAKGNTDYEKVVSEIDAAIEKSNPILYNYTCFREVFQGGIEFGTPYLILDKLKDAIKNKDKEAINKNIETLKKVYADIHNKDYDHEVDRKVAKALLPLYAEMVPADALPAFYTTIQKDFKGNYDAYVDHCYDNSIFSNEANFNKFIKKPTVKAIEKDPMTAYVRAKYDLMDKLGNELAESMKGMDLLHKTYVRGLCEMYSPEPKAPDANFTIRLTYGNVKSYNPKDGVHYKYYTTLKGVMEKEDPTNPEFVVPAKLKELYEAKDFGRYALPNGDMPACFLTTNDITGGNSGSPVINGNGELIGAAFDGNWESLSGDINFDNNLQRCIAVDIRYVLFIIDKLGGCKHLIDEMTIVE